MVTAVSDAAFPTRLPGAPPAVPPVRPAAAAAERPETPQPIARRPREAPEPPEDVVVSLAPRDPTSVLLFSPGSLRAGSDGTVLVANVDLLPNDIARIVSQRVYSTNLELLRSAARAVPPVVDQFV